ncbi:MAG TPA: isocitrate lyase/phosphoenolpyruvate mutase family protein [Thermoanaerobaculia bacterium]
MGGNRPLVLVNAWDPATARIFERAGSAAIATTSAGIAFSSGYPDGEKIPRDRMLEAVARICAKVSVPVTADMEAGYGASPEDLRRTVSGVLEAGAVGLNLEDGGEPGEPLMDLPLQLEKIRSVREVSEGLGVPIVLNARTDAYLRGIGSEKEMFEETIRRGEAYRDAGADCVFVPGITDRATIGALVRRLACPINVLAVAGSPSIDDLASLGVARVSLGSGPIRATMSLMQRLADEVLARGTYSVLEGIVSHASMNELMR